MPNAAICAARRRLGRRRGRNSSRCRLSIWDWRWASSEHRWRSSSHRRARANSRRLDRSFVWSLRARKGLIRETDANLEGDVLVVHRSGRVRGEIWRRLVLSARGTRASAQELHGLRHDLRRVTLAAAVLGVVLARRDAALDIDLPPFLEVLGTDLRKLAPRDDA